MKILYLITKSNWGGAQRYVYDLAVSMSEEGHEVLVAAGPGGILLERLSDAGVDVYRINSSQRDVNFLKDVKVLFELISLIKTTKPDIIHINSSKLGGIGTMAGLLLGKKTIFTAHGWPFQEKRNLPAVVLIWILSWLTALFSWRVIVPSNNDLRLARKMPFVNKKARLVYLGREVAFHNREDARRFLRSLAYREIDNDLPWVGILAELHPNKGHRFLLEAATSVQAYFFIVGDGELRAELEIITKKFNLADRIFFLGQVDSAASYLRAFDLMVLPSLKEGLPYTIIESGLAGVPVLASRVGGIPELIIDPKMLFTPGSVTEMRVALLNFIEKKQENRELIGSAFQNHVRGLFSKEQMVKQTLGIYREII